MKYQRQRLREIFKRRNVPFEKLMEIRTTYNTSLSRILRPALVDRDDGWSDEDIMEVMVKSFDIITEWSIALGLASYIAVLHYQELVDADNPSDADLDLAINENRVRTLLQDIISGKHTEDPKPGRELRDIVKKKLGHAGEELSIPLDVVGNVANTIVVSNRRFISENFYIYLRQCIDQYIERRSLMLENISERRLIVNVILRSFAEETVTNADQAKNWINGELSKLKQDVDMFTHELVHHAVDVYYQFAKRPKSTVDKLRQLRHLRKTV